jgi:hypothetical protein
MLDDIRKKLAVKQGEVEIDSENESRCVRALRRWRRRPRGSSGRCVVGQSSCGVLTGRSCRSLAGAASRAPFTCAIVLVALAQ